MRCVQPLSHPDGASLTLERVLHALGDPVRLTIFGRIACEAGVSCRGVCDVLPASTLSHHLRILRDAGLIRSERRGKELINTLRHEDLEARFPGLLAVVLRERAPLPRSAGTAA